MKYITLILALALCSCSVLKQVPEPVNSDYTIFHSTRGEIVYHHEQVDVVSTFPGGEPAMFEWMEKNIQYPRDAVESKKEEQPTQIHVDWGDIPNHVCLNEVVNFYVTPSGGTGQYTLTWSGAVTGSTLQNSVAVTSNSVMAIIEVKDDNLCTATSSRSVTSDPQVELDIGSVGTYDIYDGMSTNILVTASGGSSFDYTFVLSDASGAVVSTTYSAPGEFTSDITLYAGPVINETDYYTLLVYDINGCTSVTTSISVTNIGVMP